MILRPTTLRPSSRRAGAVASCAALSLTFASLTQAQLVEPPGGEAVATEGPKPRVWIEPRVSLGLKLSDNGSLASDGSRTEQVLEITPGVRGILNTARIQGYFDYALTGQAYLQNTSGNKVRHALDASATVNAWGNRAFVDMSGSVVDELLSPFDAPGTSVSRANQSQTASFRLSPYLIGSLGGLADYELRYSLQTVDNDTASRPDIQAQSASVRLASASSPSALGWTFDAQTQAIDYEEGRDTRSDSLRGGLVYNLSPAVLLSAQLGREANDILTLSRESYTTAGLGVQWRPSPRTRLSAGIEERYFGNGHEVSLQHSTGRTIWRYTDQRGVSNNGLQAGAAPLGSLRNLLDSSFQSRFPDPIERNTEVDRVLLGLGLPGDLRVFQTYLTSAATLERNQQLSVVLLGARGAATAALTRSDATRLQAPLAGEPALPDDFDTNARIQRTGWNLAYAHRLTPQTSANVALTGTRSRGTVDSSRATTLALGLGTRVAPRTTASVQLSRTRHTGSVRSYGETVIAGVITHRF